MLLGGAVGRRPLPPRRTPSFRWATSSEGAAGPLAFVWPVTDSWYNHRQSSSFRRVSDGPLESELRYAVACHSLRLGV